MQRINVTKTFLPPLEEYQKYLEQIWQRDWLTNQGPLLLELEKNAKDFLGVEDFHLVANGTIALQVALRALDVAEGEVITTPFSYVATTSAILWEQCTPVFVDINPKTFCIDAEKIEAAITSNTKAIMPVHVFGNPCEVEKIEAIAKKHKLKVIYDAAHAFGVQYRGKSLLDYGDISICSFHATKIFHTIEGGCIIARDKAVSEKVGLMKRFGHNGDDHYMLGINAKATEFQAAMGLCNLKYVTENIDKRRAVSELYDQLLGDKFQKLSIQESVDHNYAYYPIVLECETQLITVLKDLGERNIFPRRYFHPSLNTLPYISGGAACPIAEDISKRVLCLPLYPELEEAIIKKISEVIIK